MEIVENPFEIRTYGFCELAQLYFPNVAPKNAAQNLRNSIKYSAELQTRLKESGYFAGRRILLPSQVKILTEHLGEP